MPSRTIRRTPRRPRQVGDTGVFLAVVVLIATLFAYDLAGLWAAAIPLALAAVAALAWWSQRASDAPSDNDSSLA